MNASTDTAHPSAAVPRSRSPIRRRLVTVLAFVAVVLVGLAPAAYADVIAQNSAVRGRGDWTWKTHQLVDVYLGVRDLACDDLDVYVRLEVDTTGSSYQTTQRWERDDCDASNDWRGLVSNSPSGAIVKVRVKACTANGNCAVSRWHDNPTT